jgi:thymidylate synthase (FAD)
MMAMSQAATHYSELREFGWSPQQARSVLPNSLKTEIVTTCNPREWRHIFRLRTSGAAHPQMQEIMTPLLGRFVREWPILFEDLLPSGEKSP